MKYKKVIIGVLLGVSALSITGVFYKELSLDKLNLRLTDISGSRSALTDTIEGVVSKSIGKGNTIKINKDEITLSNLTDVDDEFLLTREEINKNKEFYKKMKGYNRSEVIENKGEKIFARVKNNNIYIYKGIDNKVQEIIIPLEEKERNLTNKSEFVGIELLKSDNGILYGVLNCSNIHGDYNSNLLEMNVNKKNYKAYNIKNDSSNIYAMTDKNDLYVSNGNELFKCDYKTGKYNSIIKFDQSVRFNEGYLYFLNSEDANKARAISAINLESREIIECGYAAIEQYWSEIPDITIRDDKIYKIDNISKYTDDNKRSYIIEVLNSKDKSILYKGNLELSGNSRANLEVK
ncbi:hypothetical protein [Clostridium massiliamazoniense]|uniref:hypothetical protein n=1 Tax=Clostridium massiliamazoniense TaxID=1347366 RepID=UPI0006D85973|nr:hypothetical protein [Clostridium massiliamazoniense]